MEQSLLRVILWVELEKWIFKRDFLLGSMFSKHVYETDLP